MTANNVSDPDRNAGLFVSNLSCLQLDQCSGHLLTLSDQSHLILERDVEGTLYLVSGPTCSKFSVANNALTVDLQKPV